MNYPDTLSESNAKATWLHEDCFVSGNDMEYIKSYYHRINSTIELHNHSFYEINVIVEGSGRHYIEKNNCEAEPGTVFILPPGITHGYWADGHLNIFHVLISSAFMEHFHKELYSLPGYSLLFEIEPFLRGEYNGNLFLRLEPEELDSVRSIFGKLCSLQVSEYGGKEVMKDALVLNLIGEFSEKISAKSRDSLLLHHNPHYAVIIKGMEYIRGHYSEKISFQELAHRLNMSYSTFLRHFDRICGKSPNSYLHQCRMEKAREMLMHTEKTILDIALECGYYDSSHFIRSFVEETGISPMSFRNSEKETSVLK